VCFQSVRGVLFAHSILDKHALPAHASRSHAFKACIYECNPPALLVSAEHVLPWPSWWIPPAILPAPIQCVLKDSFISIYFYRAIWPERLPFIPKSFHSCLHSASCWCAWNVSWTPAYALPSCLCSFLLIFEAFFSHYQWHCIQGDACHPSSEFSGSPQPNTTSTTCQSPKRFSIVFFIDFLPFLFTSLTCRLEAARPSL
jgi:hypothetical protein